MPNVIIRTWKSNGDQNLMSLADAVKNLRRNAIGYDGVEVSKRHTDIRERLLRGEKVETPLAVFQSDEAMASEGE